MVCVRGGGGGGVAWRVYWEGHSKEKSIPPITCKFLERRGTAETSSLFIRHVDLPS